MYQRAAVVAGKRNHGARFRIALAPVKGKADLCNAGDAVRAEIDQALRCEYAIGLNVAFTGLCSYPVYGMSFTKPDASAAALPAG
jgi:hypothetical protein